MIGVESMISQLVKEMPKVINERNFFEWLLPLFVPAINTPRMVQNAINLRRYLKGETQIDFRSRSISEIPNLSLDLRLKLQRAESLLIRFDQGLIDFEFLRRNIERLLDIHIDTKKLIKFESEEAFDASFMPAILGFLAMLSFTVAKGDNFEQAAILSTSGGLFSGGAGYVIKAKRSRIFNYQELGRQIGKQIEL
jgi:hypothetical protein